MDNFSFYVAVDALVSEGGPYVFAIFATGVLMWAIILERYLFFFSVLPRQTRKAVEEWKARTDHTSWCARQIRQKMISKVNAAMTNSFPIMQTLVPLSPLAGAGGYRERHAGSVRLDGNSRLC